MGRHVVIRVFGTLTPNDDGGSQDGWRDAAGWPGRRLAARLGDRVRVDYHDLFRTDMGRFPEGMAVLRDGDPGVPLVFVEGEMVSEGRKLSPGVIMRYMERVSLMTEPRGSAGPASC